jgi:HK97 family phage portal protein
MPTFKRKPPKSARKKPLRRGRRTAGDPAENPANPVYSDEFWAACGAGKAVAGVRVTRNKALGYPAVWRAVSLISGDVGKLPLLVYRQSGRNREVDPKHPAYRVLLRKPNDAMTAFVFKQTLMLHSLIHGNGYAYIDRDGRGVVKQLLILDPECVEPLRIEGVLWYLYQPIGGGAPRKLPADEVLHVKGLGYDGLKGYPVLRIARDALGAAIAARDHSARYFANGARPGGVLEHPGKLSDQARRNMREGWERVHKGLENSHKVAILEEGTKYQGFASNARDAQLLETREFDAREVANIFGVPTHKLGDPPKVAYNSLGEENQSYYDDTLSRWLKVFSEEAHDKLLSEKEKATESHCIDFDYQEIQRANLPAQVDFVDKLLKAGVINQDEGRAVFSYNPLPDGKGQRFFIPNTLVPVEQAGQSKPEPAPQRKRKKPTPKSPPKNRKAG